MCESDFHIISRFRNDVILYYPTLEKKTGKRGHPKWFDGRIDFAKLDLTRCKEYEVNKGKLYGLRVYAKALKRYVSLTIWYPMDGRTDKWQLYFSTDDSMDGREVLDYYRISKIVLLKVVFLIRFMITLYQKHLTRIA